jgi:hypothetical protein
LQARAGGELGEPQDADLAGRQVAGACQLDPRDRTRVRHDPGHVGPDRVARRADLPRLRKDPFVQCGGQGGRERDRAAEALRCRVAPVPVVGSAHQQDCRGRGDLAYRAEPESSWLCLARTRHSAKPEEFRTIVEQMSDGPRLELFARRLTPGWLAWGNEVPREASHTGFPAP